MLHPGRRDWWIAGLLGTLGATFTGAGLVFTALGLTGNFPLLLVGGPFLLTGLLLVSILTSTSYEIAPPHLIVRSGPIRLRVPLDAVEEIVPADKTYFGPEWSFALSTSGLRVRYRTKGGGLSWPIRIAPRDRVAFLLDATEALPQLQVCDDGSLRKPE